ncbi:MAG: type II secretion system protein J [Gammaproteobacteria bacterium]
MLAFRMSKGFSLLECLMAMGLFAWILIICEGMFVIQQKAIITVTDDIQRLDTVRQLLLRLDPLIRRAGFLGMQSVSSGLPITVHGQIPNSRMPDQSITLHRANGKNWNPPLPAVLSHKVASGTDVVIIEYANTSFIPKSGWFVMADGLKADIVYRDVYPTLLPGYDHYAVIASWQIIAVYMQKGDDGLELMQKTLLPMADAVNILTGLASFQCEPEGGLLKVTVTYAGEPISIWFGQDNHHS